MTIVDTQYEFLEVKKMKLPFEVQQSRALKQRQM